MPLGTEPKDAAKALPLRLLHGGSYLGWVREFGVAAAGVEHGRGLPQVVALASQLRVARKATVAAYRREHPAWVEAALEKARQKKARERRKAWGPLAAMQQWQRATIEQMAEASVFAVIIQDKEDECLMVALRSLAADGWRTHSLQQDGLLVEPGEREGGAPPVRLKGAGGAIERAQGAIEAAKGLAIGLLEKPFYRSPEVPAIIARFALPGTTPVPVPTPREVSGKPRRLLAHERARSAAGQAEAADRRASRAEEEAIEEAARAAEAAARLWDARCIAALEGAEASVRAAQLDAERHALEETEVGLTEDAMNGDEGDSDGADDETEVTDTEAGAGNDTDTDTDAANGGDSEEGDRVGGRRNRRAKQKGRGARKKAQLRRAAGGASTDGGD